MRRKEKEITDRSIIDAVIRQNKVCRLGLSDGSEPYVVPLCFGYDDVAIYLHCATEGRKIEILRKNPRVCIEFDIGAEITKADRACAWGINYRSVIASGTAVFLETPEEKREGLKYLMAQYAGPDRSFSFDDVALNRTAIIKVEIDWITGKQSI